MLFFFKSGGQESKTGFVWGLLPWWGEDIRKVFRRVNVVEILCTYVWKWKNEICWNYSGMGRNGEWKIMIEGVNLTMMYCTNFCKCHHVPQYNNNMILKNPYSRLPIWTILHRPGSPCVIKVQMLEISMDKTKEVFLNKARWISLGVHGSGKIKWKGTSQCSLTHQRSWHCLRVPWNPTLYLSRLISCWNRSSPDNNRWPKTLGLRSIRGPFNTWENGSFLH
jgi:hypothetical protein